MLKVHGITFNPFQENTYLLYDADSKDCFIIDPGCLGNSEQQRLQRTIDELSLQPVRLINTHCHLDHVFGNAFVAETYGLELGIHELELPLLQDYPGRARSFGIPGVEDSPAPAYYLYPDQPLELGGQSVELLFCPGHSPGHLCFYDPSGGQIVGGDVLFAGSIGRTDLPGGDMATLLGSIHSQLLPLPDETVVYPGHGPSTTIGEERRSNPFLQ
ncbi:MAG: MBL fold metallo-hydrolase [Bacteroidota bacterium]